MTSGGERAPAPTDPALRLQILSTEHWSLLASRSLAWNEAFSRATMYLATLSGAVVALALVAQQSGFGGGFTTSALVILPVVLFVGLTTLFRLAASNYHDAVCVVGMNRIRHAYLELAPELAPYFVMGTTDDPRGIARTMAISGTGSIQQFLAATPTLVTILNTIVAGVVVLAAATRVGISTGASGVAVVLAASLTFGLQQWWGVRQVAHFRDLHPSAFPGSPPSDPPPAADHPPAP